MAIIRLLKQLLGLNDRLDLSPVGSEHVFYVESLKYKGIYCSVWFNEPFRGVKENVSVPGAPKYYIDFKFYEPIYYEDVKRKVDYYLREVGLIDKVAKWEKSYHVKLFYQAVVTEVDGRKVQPKYAELWWEANYDGEKEKWNIVSEELHTGRVKVLTGLEHYKDRGFRFVGGIFLRSDFKQQFLYKGVV